MIKLVKQGKYTLLGLLSGGKALVLDDRPFFWNSGEMWLVAKKQEKGQKELISGQYRVFQVDGETGLTGQWHLELSNSTGGLQGFLLTSGLPSEIGCRRKVVPTLEKVGPIFNQG